MEGILLTQNDGAILGPIARILGMIINFIFDALDKVGIPNVGLSIILFTIFIYIILTPLTFKQQKFSKMSALMNPEIKAVQEKYKGKNDNESMQKQNAELKEVYDKYGVSPTGSCVQLLIQMPILFALYRVIYNMPAYVGKVHDSLSPLAQGIIDAGGSEFIKGLETAKFFQKQDFTLVNTIIDVLNRASTAEWNSIKENIPQVASILDSAHAQFLEYYRFGVINIADSPSYIIKTAFSEMNVVVILGALAVPALAAITQWLNVLFMPQPAESNDDNPMASSMKSMNIMMPIMSAVFCFTLPAGMGIYWIASAAVRCVQQIAINKYFDKIGLDKIIEQNKEKAAKKAEKNKEKQENLKNIASINTKNIETKSFNQVKDIPSVEAKGEPKKGSLAEKAAMVKKFNERSN